MNDLSWKILDKYFNDNPHNLVAHHLESYNDFFSSGINKIFRDNNPVRFIEREDTENDDIKKNECLLYLGGKDGSKIYFGKPIIYDDNHVHYMYPNDARLRNMWYGMTIHYDVEVDIIYYVDEEKKQVSMTLEKIYLGRFPIMLQSNFCILKTLSPEVRFNMGECRNDYGGYFIIGGKEKVIISQEKFADNMLYIKENKSEDNYSYSADVRSVSEDPSKPIRTTSVKIVAPSPVLSNKQIVVFVPNVRKPIPLFILMRALGIVSDKDIIRTCLLDLELYHHYIDLFIPSIHDANKIFNQETALKFIASFTKRNTVSSVMEILSNYFLPHIGELNFLEKAFYVGNMVFKLLRVLTKEEKPTDRDNFRFQRIELSGSLLYDLFREYYLIQKRTIGLQIDKEYYYHKGKYKKEDFIDLIEVNYRKFFEQRDIEVGFNKAFKGNWGSQSNTKRLGVVQDLNRLSWNTFISHLRKINLPMDASAKVIAPRLLNGSQWGYIDPVDTPDGGNIGLHKHIAITAYITSGFSAFPLIKWIRIHTPMKILLECTPEYLATNTKIFVNGIWIGVIEHPIQTVETLKLFRRNGIIPIFTSISFDYEHNEILIYTDSGRLTRPIYYIQNGKISFHRKEVIDLINDGKMSWEMIVSGLKKKEDDNFQSKKNRIYTFEELYGSSKKGEEMEVELNKNKSVIDYVDTSEEEGSLIANGEEDLKKNRFYTNIEIDPSLIFGVMGNQIIYPEHNPFARNAFSCGQSKQAVSVFHSNYQMRIDKMSVVLNYGQIPLIKSKYLEYINHEEQPYGVNTIVAIMSYTGYNVEDAILINEGSIKRGLFRTSYYTMYEGREESSQIGGGKSDTKFANIATHNVVGIKYDYDYSFLDKDGLVKENIPINDKIVVIGKMTSDPNNRDLFMDSSITTKKGQLGFVDKSFITEGETGTKIAKIRIREERVPAIGDKFASRSGQKGTIGLIIPEEDMPFNSDGLRPDLIINPHAIPSRMTIGQLIESLFGIVGTTYGGFGDCTAFGIEGANISTYGPLLNKVGFNASGNHLLYNGMTGEQLQADIFMGPTYYMRLKHMVKDKINYRALGPRTVLTRQTVQGRANDGGLRIGEMERDAILAHGASYFLNESFLKRGDEYLMAVCNKTGAIAIYNEPKNIFFSPFADGPLHYHFNPDGSMNIKNISRFGRSFSLLKIPYALKLLIQELQVMNVEMRIITEDNIDHLKSMSFSNNIQKLLKTENTDLDQTINNYINQLNQKIGKSVKPTIVPEEKPQYPDIRERGEDSEESVSVSTEPGTPGYPSSQESVPWATGSPAYMPPSDEIVSMGSGSSAYNPLSQESVPWATGSPAYMPPSDEIGSIGSGSSAYNPFENVETSNSNSYNQNVIQTGNSELDNLFLSLPENRKNQILSLGSKEQQINLLENINNSLQKESTEKGVKVTRFQEPTLEKQSSSTSILEVEKEKEEDKTDVSGEDASYNPSNTKKINL
jgi:DNA-directed RNA polymerase II subunit RPB2